MHVDAVSGICSCDANGATADVGGNVSGGVGPVRSAMRNGIYTTIGALSAKICPQNLTDF